MNPSLIKHRIRFLKVNKEKDFLAGKLNNVFADSTFNVVNGDTKLHDDEEKDDVVFPNVLEVQGPDNVDDVRYRFKGDVEDNEKNYYKV